MNFRFSPWFRIAALAVLVLSSALVGCGPPPDGDPDGGTTGGGSGYVSCGQMNMDAADGLDSAAFWPEGDTYGVDAFYVWELDGTAESYVYHGTKTPIAARLPDDGWKIPLTLWSAIHLAADGQDPNHFNAVSPFRLWYVPFTPDKQWQTKTGAHNDGTCPGSDTMISGRHSCQDKSQLDRQAPGLVRGRTYLFQMNMPPPPPFCLDMVCVQSCYQVIKKYEWSSAAAAA